MTAIVRWLRARTAAQSALLAFALALGARLLWILAFAPVGRAAFDTGDYALYEIGAGHLRAVGDFSNSLFLVRPPLFVLQVFALGENIWAVLLVNAVFGALTAAATVWLARRFGLHMSLALLAAVLVALDPSTIRFSAFLGPEALANLLIVVGVASFLQALRSERISVGWALLGGLALGLSSVTRPATYLLWIPLVVWQLVAQRRRWRALLLPLISFAAMSIIPTSLWAWHNAQVFDNPTLSTVSPFAMLYYRAASLENLIGDYESMDAVYLELNRRVEAEMGRDPALATADTRHGYLSASPELGAAMNRVSMAIFLENPVLYVATIPLGFVRMLGILPPVITGPGDVLVALWNTLFVLLTALGLLRAALERRWTLFFGVGLVLAYYVAGTLYVKSAGMDARERTMLTPFMAAASAYALDWMARRVRDGRNVGLVNSPDS
jgi:4-amino-4-deoxy-L-arabinose transferase-like glycosyltransferase